MLKEAIKEAATIEEAKAAAARELGVPEEKAQFEVLQAPQKKTLGLFGGCPARVRLSGGYSRVPRGGVSERNSPRAGRGIARYRSQRRRERLCFDAVRR